MGLSILLVVEEGFCVGGLGGGGEAEAVGVEAGHELPGVDDFWGFGGAAPGLWREGLLGRIEGEEAVGGGSERDDVVAERRGTAHVGEVLLVVVFQQMRRRAAHVSKKCSNEEDSRSSSFRLEDSR